MAESVNKLKKIHVVTVGDDGVKSFTEIFDVNDMAEDVMAQIEASGSDNLGVRPMNDYTVIPMSFYTDNIDTAITKLDVIQEDCFAVVAGNRLHINFKSTNDNTAKFKVTNPFKPFAYIDLTSVTSDYKKLKRLLNCGVTTGPRMYFNIVNEGTRIDIYFYSKIELVTYSDFKNAIDTGYITNTPVIINGRKYYLELNIMEFENPKA